MRLRRRLSAIGHRMYRLVPIRQSPTGQVQPLAFSGYPVRMVYCMQRTTCLVFWLIAGAVGLAQTIHGREGITLPAPPAVEAIPVSDNYFGTKIPDSYRWLEDAKSPETRAFIDAQNAYTSRYLKQARIRPQAVDDLDALENVSVTDAPIERGDSYFF